MLKPRIKNGNDKFVWLDIDGDSIEFIKKWRKSKS